MNSKDSIRLETERLTLRHFALTDADVMFRNWASDSDVTRFLPCDACHTMEETYRRIETWMAYFREVSGDAWELFVIQLKSTGEIIGTIDYAELDANARSAEVGYQIGKLWWGHGYVAEALRAVLGHGFDTVGLKRIWADYDSRNPNSGRVMVKAGMRYDKTTATVAIDSGETVSRIQYAIMAEEYGERSGSRQIPQPEYPRSWTQECSCQ